MNMQPFILWAVSGAASVAVAVERGPAMFEVLGATFAGGFCALLFSLWKSRQRKADGVDTALWAMIAFVGSMALAFWTSPAIAGREVLGVTLHKPMLCFLIAAGGTPIIEWLLTGEAFKWLRGWLPKRRDEA